MPSNCESDVSIVIPCHNREKLVSEAIESALRQGPNVDVVVVDDGSTDSSWDIVSSYPKVNAIRTDNRGVSAARNEGLRISAGRFIKFLDSDDLLPDGSIAQMLRVAARLDRKQIAVGEAVVHSRVRGSAITYGYASFTMGGAIPGPLLLRHTLHCGLPLFPRDVLLDVSGFDETLTISEDYELAARLHNHGCEFVQVPIRAYEVRDHDDDRLSRRYGAKGYQAQLRALRRASAFVRSPSERVSLGMVAWTLARDASRERLRREAEALFAFAREVGGAAARVGTAPVQLLYRAMRPYAVERLLQHAKAALGR